MEANKVVLNGEVLIDLTGDDTIESDVTLGKRFHKRDGSIGIGTNTGENLPEYDGKVIVTGIPTEESGGLDINGVIRKYVVNAKSSVSAGDFVEFIHKYGEGEFTNTTATYIEAAQIDDTRILLAYTDNGDSYKFKTAVLKINDEGVTLGKSYTMDTSSYSSDPHYRIVVLSNTKAVVMYYRQYYNASTETTYSPIARVITIDDAVLTVGNEKLIDRVVGRGSHTLDGVAITENTLVIAYSFYAGNSGYPSVDRYTPCAIIRLFTVNGEEIVPTEKYSVFSNDYIPSSIQGYMNNNVNLLSLVKLTADQIMMLYHKSYRTSSSGLTEYRTYARIATIEGENVMIGTTTDIGSGVSSDRATVVKGCKLDNDRVLAVFEKKGTGFYARVCTASGSTVNYGAEFLIRAYTNSALSVVALNETRAVLLYPESTTGEEQAYGGIAELVEINNTTINSLGEFIFDTISPTYIAPTFVSGESIMLLYNANGESKYASLTIANDTITVVEQTETRGTFVQPVTSNLYNVGVAKTSGAEGEIVEVYCAV